VARELERNTRQAGILKWKTPSFLDETLGAREVLFVRKETGKG
jgi:hypothetical protein